MSSRDMPKIIVRLPPDVKNWLMEQSLENASSQTSEIVRAVRERMGHCRAALPSSGASQLVRQTDERP
jgi:Arc-like DNA binding domain